MVIFKPQKITNNIDMFCKLASFFFIDLKRHKSMKSEKGDFYEVFVICQEKAGPTLYKSTTTCFNVLSKSLLQSSCHSPL